MWGGRTASGSTSESHAGPTRERSDFIDWLDCLEERSGHLKSLTRDQILQVFRTGKHRLLANEEKIDGDENFSQPSLSRLDVLSRCRFAKISEDGEFLIAGRAPWLIGDQIQEKIFIRQAYKDHWDIIQDHFDNQKSRQRLFISGTPGGGKSIEGLYILYKIFDMSPDNPPPIIYVDSETTNSCCVYFQNYIFTVHDYYQFEKSLAYKVMDADGPIWHVFDSNVPGNHSGAQFYGPQIIITSPGRAQHKDMKPLTKHSRLLIYLPLPSVDEMKVIRINSFKEVVSDEKMMELIIKWGCVPRTVFEASRDKQQIDSLEEKIRCTQDVEQMMAMVGSSQINHDVVSGCFVHLLPIYAVDNTTADPAQVDPEISTRNDGNTKRKADEASIIQVQRSGDEWIAHLKACYTKNVYIWASDYIRDQAFDAFLTLGSERMMPLLVNYQQAMFCGFGGLLLEPFVHKLLNETGVIGRMKNLETGHVTESFKLGPWRVKNIYQNHSQLKNAKDIINIPLKRNEAAVDCVVPYDGYCFQVTVTGKYGINRPGFHALMEIGIFDDFLRRRKSKGKSDISFVFLVEASGFDTFKLQNYHGTNKKPYAESNPQRTKYPNVTQYAFEIDLKRLYQFKERQRKDKIFNMIEEPETILQKLKITRTWK